MLSSPRLAACALALSLLCPAGLAGPLPQAPLPAGSTLLEQRFIADPTGQGGWLVQTLLSSGSSWRRLVVALPGQGYRIGSPPAADRDYGDASLRLHPIPGQPGAAWWLSSRALLHSGDAGRSWTPRMAGLPDPSDGRTALRRLFPDPDHPSRLTLEISTEDGPQLYRSTDGGQRWEALGPPLGDRRGRIGLSQSEDGRQIEAVYRGERGDIHLLSRDGGQSWQPRPATTRRKISEKSVQDL
ncbi:hypothetical protein [Chitinimonas lacunae]|uniref:Exo-alpha-sialidase n=1 Tax=Chitinimonas lacunae TaxID=1963018 RepID=A0ABV8MKQ6_9NEIS